MVELLSAIRIPVAIGLLFAVTLIGARAVGVGRARSNREIAELVTMTTIMSAAANIGNDLHRYWLAMVAGVTLGFAASLLLRRVMA
ncbi:hypothetical protein [Sphingomonas endophytica]|uniref:Uncharacterized protein n=1 Tax=Sphingomonas endophytica TaxID=869719 RepID=A0A147I5G4_9SPHN|nr:hypothetical protein [Sphingomonas endophytica]KTT73851.1 hypothetical protein NS334_06360 [Sphingomonas endophytica]